MTKEDVPESSEGRDSVLGHHARLSAHLQHNGTQQAVIHQVASAPMPTDCGESARHTHTHALHMMTSDE